MERAGNIRTENNFSTEIKGKQLDNNTQQMWEIIGFLYTFMVIFYKELLKCRRFSG